MNTLDLAIEDAIRVHDLPGGLFEPLGKLPLGLALCLAEGIAKALVGSERFEAAQLAEVRDPPVADTLSDGSGERGVRLQQPASRRDAVGLVAEALGKNLRQILDRHRAQQFGVNGGHTVGTVRADDREVGHADPGLRALLNEAHALHASLVAWEAGPDRIEKAPV